MAHQPEEINDTTIPSLDLEFVITTGPSKPDNEVSKRIRTQVMRDYLRKQTRQTITGVEEAVMAAKPDEPARFKGRFKLDSWSHKTKTKSLNARVAREKRLREAEKKAAEKEKVNETVEVGSDIVRRTASWEVTPNIGGLDPFDSLSVSLKPRSQNLLVYCEQASEIDQPKTHKTKC